MQDQASKLRDISKNRDDDDQAASSTVMAVTSGKGGVGKSNMSTNLALALVQYGKKVLLMDFDLGLANVDVLFGLYPRFTLKDVLNGKKKLKDIVIEGPEGLMIIPASSGVEEMVNLSAMQKERLIKDVRTFKNEVDIVLVDTGSGIYADVVKMLVAANEIIIIVTPEPTSITDAYAVVKVVSKYKKYPRIKLLINMCKNVTDAKTTGKKITEAAKRFLDVEISEVWAVPFDAHVAMAVRQQKPFLLQYPEVAVSSNIRKIAGNILGTQTLNHYQNGFGIESFFQDLMG